MLRLSPFLTLDWKHLCLADSPLVNIIHYLLLFVRSVNKKVKREEHKNPECVGRESNPGQLLGRQLCSPLYHRRLCWVTCFVKLIKSGQSVIKRHQKSQHNGYNWLNLFIVYPFCLVKQTAEHHFCLRF